MNIYKTNPGPKAKQKKHLLLFDM